VSGFTVILLPHNLYAQYNQKFKFSEAVCCNLSRKELLKIIKTKRKKGDLTLSNKDCKCNLNDNRGGNYDGIDFSSFNIEKIDWRSSSFKDANFTNTLLTELKIFRADFSGAVFKKTQFKNVLLDGASFEGAKFSQTSFKNARMTRVNLNKTSLKDVTFENIETNHPEIVQLMEKQHDQKIKQNENSLEARIEKSNMIAKTKLGREFKFLANPLEISPQELQDILKNELFIAQKSSKKEIQARSYCRAGYVAHLMKNDSSAISYYSKALDLNKKTYISQFGYPNDKSDDLFKNTFYNCNPIFDLADIYLKKDNKDAALKYLTDIIKSFEINAYKNYGYLSALYYKGRLLEKLEKETEASTIFEKITNTNLLYRCKAFKWLESYHLRHFHVLHYLSYLFKRMGVCFNETMAETSI
jgi:uncharacterized protein YjbI with pentapeptide repeats